VVGWMGFISKVKLQAVKKRLKVWSREGHGSG